jgi:hypothetical protein
MRLLHSIRPRMPAVAVWGKLVGRNGRAIDVLPHGWEGMRHLWVVERGTPPGAPGNNESHIGRRWWQPYVSNEPQTIEQRLTPMCGRIRSRSTGPRWYRTSSYESPASNPNMYCMDCATLAMNRGLQMVRMADAVMNDPWTQQGNWMLPDPISGL